MGVRPVIRACWPMALALASLASAGCGQANPIAPAAPPAAAPAAAPLRATVTEISPGSLRESASATRVRVGGSRFRPGLHAALTRPDGSVTTVKGDEILELTDSSFELVLSLAAGSHSLVVTNPDSAPSDGFAFSVAEAERAPEPPPPAAAPAPPPTTTPPPSAPPPTSPPAPAPPLPTPPAPPVASCVAVTGVFDPGAPGFIVVFKDGTNVDATLALLTAKYGFTPTHIYRAALLGFSARLTDSQLQGLRCEDVVKSITYNASAGIGF